MPDDNDNVTNSVTEAKHGRPETAIPLLAKVVVGQAGRIRTLETEIGLLVHRVEKLEAQQTW